MTTAALDKLEPLLRQLRNIDDLIEVERAVFCLKSKPRQPFLHFHEEQAGLFADLRVGPNTRTSTRTKDHGRVRLPVDDSGEQGELLERVLQCVEPD